MIYKVLFKSRGTYIVLSLENVSVLPQLLKIDFDQSYEPFSQIKTIAFCRRHQAEEVMVNQRTIGPENAHLKPDLGVLSHHEMTLTLNTHTLLLTSQVVCICKASGLRLQ